MSPTSLLHRLIVWYSGMGLLARCALSPFVIPIMIFWGYPTLNALTPIILVGTIAASLNGLIAIDWKDVLIWSLAPYWFMFGFALFVAPLSVIQVHLKKPGTSSNK
jgi:hypothetical protein